MYWTPPWGASSQALGTGADKRTDTPQSFRMCPSQLGLNANNCGEEIPPRGLAFYWLYATSLVPGFPGHCSGSSQHMANLSPQRLCHLEAGECIRPRIITWLCQKEGPGLGMAWMLHPRTPDLRNVPGS